MVDPWPMIARCLPAAVQRAQLEQFGVGACQARPPAWTGKAFRFSAPMHSFIQTWSLVSVSSSYTTPGVARNQSINTLQHDSKEVKTSDVMLLVSACKHSLNCLGLCKR